MYLRLTRNSGIRVGLIGTIILFPFAVIYWTLWLTIMSLVWTCKFIMWFLLLPSKVSDFVGETPEQTRARCMANHPSNRK